MSEINSRVWIDDGIYIKELQEENARLRDALDKYGRHYGECGILNPSIHHQLGVPPKCTCGFTEALKSPHDGKE